MTNSMYGRHVLVTGAGGFMGSQLVTRLLGLGAKVAALDLMPAPPHLSAIPGELHWIQANFSDDAVIARLAEDVDVVFHLACSLLPAHSNVAILRDAKENLLGTLHLLESLAMSNRSIRFVFASSGGTIYGKPRSIPIPEAFEGVPICSYGILKKAIENYLLIFRNQSKLRPVSLRVSNPYGPGQLPRPGHGVVATFLAAALNGDPIEIWGDGSVTRDYVFIQDVVDAFVQVATSDSEVLSLNIGSGIGLSIIEIAKTIESCIGVELKKSFKNARPFDVPVNVLDVSAAYALLGWKPKTELRDGIVQTYNWLKEKTSNLVP